MTARMRAIGWKVWRIDAPMTEHDANMITLRQWWRRAQRGGFGYAQVWSVTAGLAHRLYGRQIQSALFWVVVLPLGVILAAITLKQPLILAALLVMYVVQLARIAGRDRGQGRWARSALILLAKVPESVGAARFLLAGRKGRVPEHKS